ncbi:MAG: radical SAM family heme chaperone HemW [Clostridium sp.]|nr:radical SAM family heme chaperone HemW [Clostridium sp.]
MSGIYIHIPFCQRRCIYCDFFSTTRTDEIPRYVNALTEELKLRQTYLKADKLSGGPTIIDTVYLGGGTPSQLKPELVEKLLGTLHAHYDVNPKAEITVEANPDDVTDEWARALRGMGVNRISMGVQTFDDNRLRFLCRRHTGRQALDAVELCRKAGFDNISLDLIYGLPEQTVEEWSQDVKQAISTGVEHLSAYALIYEEGTALWRLREAGRVAETAEEVSLRMFEYLITELESAGFEHYEISNFARPLRRSRHNSSYWQGIPYLGCGAAAHSFDGQSRQWNAADIDHYIQGVEHLHRHGDGTLLWEREQLTREELYNERIITSIRTREGLDMQRLQRDFGEEAVKYCLRMAAPHLSGETLLLTDSNRRLRLSRTGIFVSDGIMSDLLMV